MSLDIALKAIVTETVEVFEWNITHNLNVMAEAAEIYKELWRPEEMGFSKAHQLIIPLKIGLERLLDRPDHFKTFNPENGWGDYEGLVEFVKRYIEACEKWPDADIWCSR